MFFNLAELRVKQHNFTKYFMVVALILLTCQMGLTQPDSGWRGWRGSRGAAAVSTAGQAE